MMNRSSIWTTFVLFSCLEVEKNNLFSKRGFCFAHLTKMVENMTSFPFIFSRRKNSCFCATLLLSRSTESVFLGKNHSFWIIISLSFGVSLFVTFEYKRILLQKKVSIQNNFILFVTFAVDLPTCRNFYQKSFWSYLDIFVGLRFCIRNFIFGPFFSISVIVLVKTIAKQK